MTQPKVITIDGPAGSGKSTVAKDLAVRLGWRYVSTGLIYRTFALLINETHLDKLTDDSVNQVSKKISENYRQDHVSGRVFIDDREITHLIRTPVISEAASILAQDERVRKYLLPIQRQVVIDCHGAIVDGRDMGTVVFPDAPLKIYLTASPDERANRRQTELRTKGGEVNLAEILKEIHERDERDANRSTAPMVPATDAVLLDSTKADSQTIVQSILKIAQERNLIPQ